jgi:hypothetical protein
MRVYIRTGLLFLAGAALCAVLFSCDLFMQRSQDFPQGISAQAAIFETDSGPILELQVSNSGPVRYRDIRFDYLLVQRRAPAIFIRPLIRAVCVPAPEPGEQLRYEFGLESEVRLPGPAEEIEAILMRINGYPAEP